MTLRYVCLLKKCLPKIEQFSLICETVGLFCVIPIMTRFFLKKRKFHSLILKFIVATDIRINNCSIDTQMLDELTADMDHSRPPSAASRPPSAVSVGSIGSGMSSTSYNKIHIDNASLSSGSARPYSSSSARVRLDPISSADEPTVSLILTVFYCLLLSTSVV